MTEQPTQEGLQIKQQNCKNSKNVSLILMNTTDPKLWDIILIQEPYLYPDSKITITSPHWYPIYLLGDPNDNKPLSSLILVSTQLTSGLLQQIQIKSHLITAITLMLPSMTIDIYDIYNTPILDEALIHLQTWLHHNPHPLDISTIWAGDFNKHNALWTGPNHPRQCQDSNTDLLIQLLAQKHLDLQLPANTPTY